MPWDAYLLETGTDKLLLETGTDLLSLETSAYVQSISESVGPATDTVSSRSAVYARSIVETVGPAIDTVNRIGVLVRSLSETVGPAIDSVSGGITPLTLYSTTTPDAALITARDLSGQFNPQVFLNVTVGATGVPYWVELWSEGNTVTTTNATQYAPTGQGFIYPIPLTGARFKAGTWTFKQRVAITTPAATATADVHFRAYTYNAGVYTFICEGIAAAVALVSNGTAVTATATGVPELILNSGDQLYFDIQLNVTATTSFVAGTKFQVVQGLQSQTGFTTPGYVVDRTLAVNRTIIETVSAAADSVVGVYTPGSVPYIRSITETVSAASDSVVGIYTPASVAYTRSITETVSAASDSVAKVIAFKRGAIETVTAADIVTRLTAYTRASIEAVSPATDSPSRLTQYYRNISESIGIIGGPAVEGTWGILDISGNGLIAPPQPGVLVLGTGWASATGTYTYGYSWTRNGVESGLSGVRLIALTAGQGGRIPALSSIPLGVTLITYYCTLTTGAGMHTGVVGTAVPSAGAVPAFNVVSDGNSAALPISGGTVILQPNTAWTTFAATPNVTGMCVRVGWGILSSDGFTYDLSILKPFMDSCITNSLKFSLRIMAGQWCPAGYFADVTSNNFIGTGTASSNWLNPGDAHQGGSGVPIAPFPFSSTGGINTAFETRYQAYADMVGPWARSFGALIPLLHFCNYGFAFSEMYFGALVKSVPSGYSYVAFILGHTRLMDIAAGVMGPDIAIEFPCSGTGALISTGIGVNHTQVDLDMYNYAVLKSGGNPNLFFLQLNGFGPAPITGGIGGSTWATNVQFGGSATEQTDWDMQVQTYGPGIGHAAQMIQPLSYDWSALYMGMKYGPYGPWDIKYLEVYVGSIQLANAADLIANIASWNPGQSAYDTASHAAFVLTRNIIETVGSAADSVARIVHDIRGITETTGPAVDNIARVVHDTRSVTETTGPSTDSVTRVTTKVRSITENISAVDSVIRVAHLVRSIAESVGSAVDSVTKITQFRRSIAEIVGPAIDSAVGIQLSPNARDVFETVGPAVDVVNRVANKTRTLSETAGPASDSPTETRGIFRSVAEIITSAVDVVARVVALARSTNEAGISTDSVNRVTASNRSVSEIVISAVDTPSRIAGKTRQLAESIPAASDFVNLHQSLSRSVSETSTTSDSVLRQIGYGRTLTEVVPAADASATYVKLTNYVSNPVETLPQASDSVIWGIAISRAISESIGPAFDTPIDVYIIGGKPVEQGLTTLKTDTLDSKLVSSLTDTTLGSNTLDSKLASSITGAAFGPSKTGIK